ncbi:hypothetical protein [Raoultibacter timonensis]|uniref:hypothetical protein n=1 Tax=Raoultibacter timonensis TaxID=1907662 RepID=UPI0026DC7ED4|nr:hypothetical protein [Raoultibacter timonensis]
MIWGAVSDEALCEEIADFLLDQINKRGIGIRAAWQSPHLLHDAAVEEEGPQGAVSGRGVSGAAPAQSKGKRKGRSGDASEPETQAGQPALAVLPRNTSTGPGRAATRSRPRSDTLTRPPRWW